MHKHIFFYNIFYSHIPELHVYKPYKFKIQQLFKHTHTHTHTKFKNLRNGPFKGWKQVGEIAGNSKGILEFWDH